MGLEGATRQVPERAAVATLDAAHAEIERLTEDLERLREDFRQVLYATSHDLAEPLQIVLSYAELLTSHSAGELDETEQRYLAGIQVGAMRVRKLIDGLLAYSRLGRYPPDLTDVDCSAVVDEALEVLSGPIAKAGAKITVEALPTVWGAWGELASVFENLLDNAIKFRANEPPRIRVSATQQDGDWCFSVRDNGIGINPRQRMRIFEIFQRLHTRHEYEGTGLGLAICRKIVERHGGRIWVESRPDLGSTFRFTIPITPQTTQTL
jgi:light-regulated signal transduction histidine kinase (bacteriophytochrome)